MFCRLSYRVEKEQLRSFALTRLKHFRHHKTDGSEIRTWLKLFEVEDSVKNIISDLGLSGLDVRPRYSLQRANTELTEHIDHEGIVGINFNLMPEPAVIHLREFAMPYEAALIDVGAVPHSVRSTPKTRLVLKLAIRAPWSEVYRRVKHYVVNPVDSYVSVIKDHERHLVKL